MDFHAGFGKLAPKAVNCGCSRAVAEPHAPRREAAECRDRAVHPLRGGGGQMKPAEERMDGQISGELGNVVQRVDPPGVGAAEDHG